MQIFIICYCLLSVARVNFTEIVFFFCYTLHSMYVLCVYIRDGDFVCFAFQVQRFAVVSVFV